MTNSIPLPIANEPTGQPERSDAIANRQRILAATRRLFAQHGPAAVSMSDIVQAAGIGRGTLYRHFANKGELCLAVMDEQLAEFQNQVLADLRQMMAAALPALTQLDAFLHRLVWLTETYTPLLREAQRQGVPYFDKKEGTPQHWQQATVFGLLRLARANGEIAATADIEYLTDALLAPLNAGLFHYQRTVQGFSPERISAGLRSWVARLAE